MYEKMKMRTVEACRNITEHTHIYICMYVGPPTYRHARLTSRQMGARNLFDGKASDLSGITGDRRLSVSFFFHKAVLKVDEEGGGGEASTCA